MFPAEPYIRIYVPGGEGGGLGAWTIYIYIFNIFSTILQLVSVVLNFDETLEQLDLVVQMA